MIIKELEVLLKDLEDDINRVNRNIEKEKKLSNRPDVLNRYYAYLSQLNLSMEQVKCKINSLN